MSSARSPRFRRRLALRLSLWYGGVLVLSTLVCFGVFYGLVASSMRARTDAELTRLAGIMTQTFDRDGLNGLQSQIDTESASFGVDDVYFRVFDSDGKQLLSSNLSSWNDLVRQASPGRRPSPPRPVFGYLQGTGHHSMVRVSTSMLNRDLKLQVGITIADDRRVIEDLREVLLLVVLVTVVVAVLVGGWMARRALSGMHGVTQTAQRISQGASLESRVPVTGLGDEVDELAQTVNGMLDRIQTLVQGMKETNDHLAHELRSPVTRLRGRAEVTLLSQSSSAEFQAMAAGTVEECDRLLTLINTMLDISEMEGRVGDRPLADIDMARMVADVGELFQPVAEDKRVTLRAASDGACLVKGDFQRLQRALANLVDNAVKYSPDGGAVDLRAERRGNKVVITTTNGGPGIPPDELPHVFERFYRGRSSRSLAGNGLGLSLSRAIVRAHGGDISATSEENGLTTFTATLPGSAASQA